MRIVIDTNVVMSAIFFGGKPRELVEMLMSGRLSAFATKNIISEYTDTLSYLCDEYPAKSLIPPLSLIIERMNIIDGKTKISVCRDPDDDKFIECAIDADCLYIISGDKDLLSIEEYSGIRILTAAEFMQEHCMGK